MNDRTAEHGSDLHQHLLHMLGAKDHQDAAKIIAGLHGQCLTLNRMADTAERREAQTIEQMRTLWIVVREAGAAGGVRLTREMMATDWSRASLQRSDDFATGDVILTARLQGDPLADHFDDDQPVQVGDDPAELQRALVAIAQALACDCELDDILHAVDRLQSALDDERGRATRYANGAGAATAAVAKIAENLGVRADLPRILDQIDAIRLNGAGLGVSPDINSMARALASRFVPKTEPQRLAALQTAIVAAIETHRVQPADTVGEQVRAGDRPGGARPVVTITVAGIVGVGKSAIALTILDTLRAAGLLCEWSDEAEERGMGTDGNDLRHLEVKPIVRLVEVCEPRAPQVTVNNIMAAGIGARRITAARLHQLTGEGYSRDDDRRYTAGELAQAAAAYVMWPWTEADDREAFLAVHWPHGWDHKAFKPKDRIADLERAGALIAAEIDRIEAGTARETRKGTPPGSVYTEHATIPVALIESEQQAVPGSVKLGDVPVGDWEARAEQAHQDEVRAAEFEARAALADDVEIGAADRALDAPAGAVVWQSPAGNTMGASVEVFQKIQGHPRIEACAAGLDGLPPGYAPKPDAPAPLAGGLTDFPANTAPEGKPIPVVLEDGREFTAAELVEVPYFDLVAHLIRQRAWSVRTFGPGERTAGVIDHIRKELIEVEADPGDVFEWIDLVILAFDGAWRAGHDVPAIVGALQAKQAKNESRTWPDWRTAEPGKAIEHDRTGEQPAAGQDGAP